MAISVPPVRVFGAQLSVQKSSSGFTRNFNDIAAVEMRNANFPYIKDPHAPGASGTDTTQSGARSTPEYQQTDDWRIAQKGYL